jgi:hypothetical protein
MEKPSNDDELKIASKLFMKTCEEYVVTHHKRALQFLKEKIMDPGYETIRLNLLYSLHMTVQNTKDEKSLSELKRDLKRPLKEMTDITLEEAPDGAAIRLYAIETLCAILDEEERFKELMDLYVNGVLKKSELTDNIRNIILSAYPEKRFEVNKALFEKLKDSRKEIRKRFRDEITRVAIG